MRTRPWIRGACLALLLAAGATAHAQRAPGAYVPKNFQPGKDVVWLPTPRVLVDRMLDMAKVTKDDYVIDLGSGDGRTVIAAAKRGARALGIEYNPDMVELSRRNAAQEGVTARAEFARADLFETDLSKATVITLFLLPDINQKLRPKLLELKPGTRVVSNTFGMGDWVQDEISTLNAAQGCTGDHCSALLWVVPARVAGTYRHALGSLVLTQDFQMLKGMMTIEEKKLDVIGKVTGENISFIAGGLEYNGRANGKVLELH